MSPIFLAFINDDELVEVTPADIRLRKWNSLNRGGRPVREGFQSGIMARQYAVM
jgi:hypothetical protein